MRYRFRKSIVRRNAENTVKTGEKNMNLTLCDAIRSRKVIEFHFDGGVRTVEPFCHGVSTAGNEVLRGYQTAGYSSSGRLPEWRLFTVSKISGLVVTGDRFQGSRPGYNPNDSAMNQIHCCV